MSNTNEAEGKRPFTFVGNQLLVQFGLVLAMDLLARTGYQMGKSPVLPLFSRSLGASAGLSGAMVAISTMTGLITSPLVGTLSDFYGRRRLLIAGTTVFALMPFFYLLIQTPGQLFVIRLVHGFATAIYGPVVTALVADMFQRNRAQYIGWYRSTRTASYLLGPLLGGLVLHFADFRWAWVSVGFLGLAAFLPAIALPSDNPQTRASRHQIRTGTYIRRQLIAVAKNPTLLSLGIVQAALYLGLRANTAFLPLYADAVGINAAQIGGLFSIQVAATLLTQPLGGYLADRFGHRQVLVCGLVLVAVALPAMIITTHYAVMVILATILGLGEAAVMPAICTLATRLSSRSSYGSVLGILDAMDNVGKALGPILAGILVGVLDGYLLPFLIISGVILSIAVAFVAIARGFDEFYGKPGKVPKSAEHCHQHKEAPGQNPAGKGEGRGTGNNEVCPSSAVARRIK